MKHIAIEGCVGAGKTTVARLLSEKMAALLLLEQFVWNPFLDKFYQEPSRYALETELGFILIHYHQLREALRTGIDAGVVSDFCFAKDKIFCDLNLAGDEARLFKTLYEFLAARLSNPDVVVCLHCTDDLVLRRIEQRSRDREAMTSHEYFRRLNAAYERFFRELSVPKVDVDMDARDFLEDESHVEWLVKELLEVTT